MKIGIASDHRGVKLKAKIIKYLESKGYEVVNYGTDTIEQVDYPDYAYKVGHAIQNNEIQFGFLVCGTGIGMCIAANRMSGVRCARVFNREEAKLTRFHNNANVLAFSSKTCFFKVKKLIDIFLETSYSDLDRHNLRLKKLEELK